MTDASAPPSISEATIAASNSDAVRARTGIDASMAPTSVSGGGSFFPDGTAVSLFADFLFFDQGREVRTSAPGLGFVKGVLVPMMVTATWG